MRIESIHLLRFKRFADLLIRGISTSAKLVVITGPNGVGKSAILEAINQYRRARKFGQSGDYDYFVKKEGDERPLPMNVLEQISMTLADGEPSVEEILKGMWVRSAYRHQPDFTNSGISQQGGMVDDPGSDRLINADQLVGINYQRLLSQSVARLFNQDNRKVEAGALVDAIVGRLQTELADIFDGMQLDNLVDPLGEGTFFFSKGSSKHYAFKNLSGGERAALDILLDLIVRRENTEELLYALDEPELHLGSRVQAKLLDSLLRLLPRERSQLWIATHSIGMMKRAVQLYREDPTSVVFIDMSGHNFDEPVVLEPRIPTLDFWRSILEVALDDLATLVAPTRVVLCEGDEIEDGFDASCYRIIFGKIIMDTEFMSTGNSLEVKNDRQGVAAAIQLLAPGTKVSKLIDRDDLSETQVAILKSEGTRVLSYRNIESYLLSDEIVRKLCAAHGATTEQADAAIAHLKQEQTAAHARGKAVDDRKPIAPNMRAYLVQQLGITARGSNFAEFARNELAPLITPETETYRTLHSDIFE